jgi:serine protease Do
VLDTVIAIGNAEGEGFSATKGVVSVNSEQLTLDGPDQRTDITVRVIRIDAAINKGNSGGGLFDEQGRLIGIVNAKKTGDKVDNIAYAIPINLAKALADNVIYHSDGEFRGAVKYLFGIRLAEVELGISLDENGEINV